ncbi:MAG: beta-ketoacyl-ACP synthase 3, partial [Burkholderiales bacterium]|nr:beta-ketoacyl-ACP synthase 3 [Burkholderiales bacterium]
IGWGNTVALCREASETLEEHGISVEIIDLRTIKPYDKNLILKSVGKTKNLVVVHEDNLTCGLGGDILATVLEYSKVAVKAKRITRADTYTPCNFRNQLEVLPSYDKILSASCELLNIDLTWEIEKNTDPSIYNVEVIGASPSDESVLINTIFVKPGDVVKSGDKLVDIEASKASGEILSPCNGVVEELMVNESDRAIVGNILLKIRLQDGITYQMQQKPAKAILNKQPSKLTQELNYTPSGIYPVGMNIPSFKTGSRLVKNSELLINFPEYSDKDIIQRTGIHQRYWLDNNENILEIATNATLDALNKANLKLSDIDAIICATCSPDQYQSPSTACLVLDKLYKVYGEHSILAYDINAACSGFIYALQNAQEYLKTRPNKRVLLITAEYLSKLVNKNDFDTAFLFGDAATACIISGADYIEKCDAIINQVYLTSIAENGDILSVPTKEHHSITLQGKKLFSFAVKSMAMATHKCCQSEGLELSDLDLVIPHQANQRIIDAIERRLNMKSGSMYSNISNYGNTSSCTIPIAMSETLDKTHKNNKILLAAFGGGFTIGSAILTSNR